MRTYPDRTGALCAKMARGLSGQDGFNDMVVTHEILRHRERPAPPDEHEGCGEHAGHDARRADRYENGHKFVGGGISATLDASYYKGTGSRNGKEREVLAVGSEQSKRKYVIRRLTPIECLRLQGLPDWWCDGANGSDSAIYKMAGNGLAIPCAYDALRRIAEYAEKEDTEHGTGG